VISLFHIPTLSASSSVNRHPTPSSKKKSPPAQKTRFCYICRMIQNFKTQPWCISTYWQSFRRFLPALSITPSSSGRRTRGWPTTVSTTSAITIWHLCISCHNNLLHIIIKSNRIKSFYLILAVSNHKRIFAYQIVSKWAMEYIILNWILIGSWLT